jgi:hypothetical protein
MNLKFKKNEQLSWRYCEKYYNSKKNFALNHSWNDIADIINADNQKKNMDKKLEYTIIDKKFLKYLIPSQTKEIIQPD